MARQTVISSLIEALRSKRAWRAGLLGLLALGAAGQAAQATPILLVEADTGKVLEQQDAGKPWYPASVTKLMTVYVALTAMRHGRVAPDTPFTVSALASAQQPTKMGFPVGTEVTLDNALKMLMVKSANDMAIVIAEGVSGSMPAFVDEMNRTAQRLGMTGTHFANPNGLPDPEQFTTARDLAILARALIYHFPEQETLFRIPAIRLGKIVLRNYNRLIDRYPGADGMKTGFICASGFNLVATATRGNKRLIVVILGAPSAVARTEEAALLFERGFQPSWNIFGNAAPQLDTIANLSGEPTDMSRAICNRKRSVAAAENEDEMGAGGSARTSFAASLPGVSGADLLQTLPPSMPVVQVYIGTRKPAPAPATAVAATTPGTDAPAKKKPAATATASASAAGQSDAKKPAPATAPAAAKKPAPTATAAASGGEGQAAAKKKVVQPTAPATASSIPAPKPKPKPVAAKPADAPAAAAPQPPARPGT